MQGACTGVERLKINKTLDMNGTDAFNNVIVGMTQMNLTEKSGANVTKIPQ
jgi:hypothetical protein